MRYPKSVQIDSFNNQLKILTGFSTQNEPLVSIKVTRSK